MGTETRQKNSQNHTKRKEIPPTLNFIDLSPRIHHTNLKITYISFPRKSMRLAQVLICMFIIAFVSHTKAKADDLSQNSIDSLLKVIDKMADRNYVAALSFIDSALNETNENPAYANQYLFFRIKKSSILVRAKAYHKALQNLLEIEPEVNHSPDVSLKAFYQGITAYIYGDQGNYEMAIPSFRKALAFYQDLKDYKKMAATLSNLATCYLAIGSLEEAVGEINKALTLYKIHQFDNVEGIYITAGEIELELKNYEQALVYLNHASSIEIADQSQCEINLLIARAFIGLNKFSEAQKFINSCEGKIENNLGMTFTYYLTLVEYFKSISQFDSALIYNQKALKLSRDIDAQQTSEAFEIIRLNDRYENQNLQLLQTIETKQFEQKLYIVIILLSILSVGFLTYAVIIKRRDYRLLQIQNDEIAAQSEELKSMTEELASQGDALKQANEKLEAKVLERTAQLMTINSQLREYAFFNAHKLRSPIATILGLKELLSVSTSPDEKEKIIALIFTTTEKFDEVVKESQQKLNGYDEKDLEGSPEKITK